MKAEFEEEATNAEDVWEMLKARHEGLEDIVDCEYALQERTLEGTPSTKGKGGKQVKKAHSNEALRSPGGGTRASSKTSNH